jgi:peptidoglycan-associated lipoprotein
MRHIPLALWVLGLSWALVACPSGPEYPNCNEDEDCAEQGEVCVDGTCQQCRTDAQCAEGEQCVGGRCEMKPECVRDADCEGNQICRSGKCQLECESDDDCGRGLACRDNRCVDPLACDSDRDCDPGFTCYNGRCTDPTTIATERCDYPTVRFAFNKANLTSEVRSGLQQVVDCLQQKGGTIVIEGHADERGTEEYNLALGDRRAQAVKDYLTRLGVPASKLRVVSKGETDPADPRHNEAAWAKNRRVEFLER